jgi:hypothetical protein
MLDNTAKLSDIITELQNLEGINQKADLKSALISKGISASDTDSMSTLISKVNSSLYGSNIKSIQRGRYENTSALVTIDIPVSTIDMSSSIVLLSVRTSDGRQAYGAITGVITSLNNIRLQVGIGSSQIIYWTLIEFNNVKSIQRGSFTYSANATNNPSTITINSVNTNKSFVIATHRGSNITYAHDVACDLLNSTTLTVDANLAGTLEWQAIEFN